MANNNGWTDERKQAQRQAIQRWKPWTKTTGPKTIEGKLRSSQNARKHGAYDAELLEILRHARKHLKNTHSDLELLRSIEQRE